MRRLWVLTEHPDGLRLVLALKPETLARALAHLKRGEVPEALERLREAADLYLGAEDDPPAELHRRLAAAGGAVTLAEVPGKVLREVEPYAVPARVYPVTTGTQGLSLLVVFPWYSPQGEDTEAYAVVHLPPEHLGEREVAL